MGGRSHKPGEESEDHIEDYVDELPDDQVVRRFLCGHERHRAPPRLRKRKPDEESEDAP
jgi:hypothetical protein